MGARKNVAYKGVSLARPVLSCAHYFQAPATQAKANVIICHGVKYRNAIKTGYLYTLGVT